MIPEFDPTTGALPAGIHEADWAEVVARFGATPRRAELLQGMRAALTHLAEVGCRRVYLGGSFVTATEVPGDWDGCYEPIPATTSTQPGPRRPLLSREIATGDQVGMHMWYAGEIYNARETTKSGNTFLEFFQTDRDLRPVGIVAIDLATIE